MTTIQCVYVTVLGCFNVICNKIYYMKGQHEMIKLRLKASQYLILLVENMGTGEKLPVGKKVKFEPWHTRD